MRSPDHAVVILPAELRRDIERVAGELDRHCYTARRLSDDSMHPAVRWLDRFLVAVLIQRAKRMLE
jgi:hypothetical protein